MKKLSIAAIVLSVLAIVGEILICASSREDSEEVLQRAISNNYRIYSPILPDTMSFAGEKVPLSTYYVRRTVSPPISNTSA